MNLTTAKSPIVRVRNLRKNFNGRTVLDGIDFTVQEGEFIAIIGPSGCGKTTLLRCLMGLERVESGSITVCGFPVAGNMEEQSRGAVAAADLSVSSLDELRSRMCMVFQHLYLWPLKTVRDNIIAAPRYVLGMPYEEALRKCRALLQRVGLEGVENAFPGTLSGGQQQRIALARVLAMEPEVLLLDEITSALDPELVVDLLDLMRDLLSQRRTVIVVTHELRFAREVADRVLFMVNGKVVEESTSEDFFVRPQSQRAREFLDKVNRIRR
jgi:ABC-type polar amino acid transport system ATPase subunit